MKRAVLALSLCPAAVAAQATQLDFRHQHGSGSLDMAFAGAEFTLSLAVPSFDIIGFERPADSDDDRALVAVAISDLSKPLELFVISEDAGCITTSANVILTNEGFGKKDEDEAGEADTTADEYHAEFQADYAIQCQDMNALGAIEFAFFNRFENVEELRVRVELSDKIHAFDVTPATPILDISAIQ
ncbi:DUF2796 domain-containing protein [uncultured Ruegeria sp.]|uniref:ZrgA family zinc uptake protein n=1 Tax=uncultured Ruegeria sp. TaxID=259304 RepID=UPI0026320767|nr:DUF2796 domain-containing protein [uncultured Ruegeria sp.]